MQCIDVTTYFECVAQMDFPMKGEVWAKIQKVISKTIGNFTSADIA